jgi:phosphatidylglycerophosphate synthase
MKMNNRIPSSPRPDLVEQKPLLNLDQKDLEYPKSNWKVISTYFKKHIADAITLFRVFLGFFLLGAALLDGKAWLSRDIWILVLSWTTDMVDGWISRTLKTAHKTWLGKNDVYVDMFVSIAVLVYLGATGLLPLSILVIYLLVWSLVFWRWGIPAVLAQVFQNPIYLYFVFLTVQAEPSILLWLLLWGLAASVLFWRRGLELYRNLTQAAKSKRS